MTEKKKLSDMLFGEVAIYQGIRDQPPLSAYEYLDKQLLGCGIMCCKNNSYVILDGPQRGEVFYSHLGAHDAEVTPVDFTPEYNVEKRYGGPLPIPGPEQEPANDKEQLCCMGSQIEPGTFAVIRGPTNCGFVDELVIKGSSKCMVVLTGKDRGKELAFTNLYLVEPLTSFYAVIPLTDDDMPTTAEAECCDCDEDVYDPYLVDEDEDDVTLAQDMQARAINDPVNWGLDPEVWAADDCVDEAERTYMVEGRMNYTFPFPKAVFTDNYGNHAIVTEADTLVLLPLADLIYAIQIEY